MKSKIYEKMTPNYHKSYLGYLNKLVEEYNISYQHSIGKNPIDADYSILSGKIETNSELSKFKVDDKVRKSKYKNGSSKSYT